MVYALARASGGDIEVTTGAGEGTRFEISFPRHYPDPTHQSVQTGTSSDGLARRILVVEDDEQVGAMLSEMLRTLGYAVTEIRNVERALSVLTQDAEFDLVLTDVVMPGMSGYDLVRNMGLKNIDIPAIMMSGYTPRTEGKMIRSTR